MTIPAPDVRQGVSATLLLLGLLLSVDALFVVLHVAHAWSPWLNGAHYRLDTDRGLAEVFQYIKFLWLLGCLAFAFAQTRRGVYGAWMLLFAVLLLDDVTQLHETVGLRLAAALGLVGAFGLRPEDFGELFFAAGLGALAVALVLATVRAGAREARQLSADMLVLLCALAFFGVFVDAAHTIAFFEAPRLVVALTVLEDGGEMLVVSVLTAYAFDIASNAGRQRIALWNRIRGVWPGSRRESGAS